MFALMGACTVVASCTACGAAAGPALNQGSPELGSGVSGTAGSTGAAVGSSSNTATKPSSGHATTSTSTTTSTAVSTQGSPSSATGASTTSASTTKNAASSAATLTPATPGTYTYAQSGSLTVAGSTSQDPPTGTVVVQAPTSKGTDTWTQVWENYVNTSQAPTDETFLIDPSGFSIESELVQMSYGGQTASFDCTFDQPVLILPWPAKVGYSFSGSGTCGSGIDLTVSGTITGTQPVTLDGTTVTTYVISTAVKTTGQVTSTDNETDWFAPSLRLDAKSQSNESGSYGPFPFSAQVTRTLESGHPS